MSAHRTARTSATGPLCRLAGPELDQRRRTAAARRASATALPGAPWGTDQPRLQLAAVHDADTELLARLEAEASNTSTVASGS